MSTRSLFVPSLLAGIFLAGHVALSAQTPSSSPPIEEDDVIQLDRYEVSGRHHLAAAYVASEGSTATRLSAPLRETPHALSVLPRSLLEDTLARRPEDVASYVSGVSRGSRPKSAAFIVRGFEVEGQTYVNGGRDVIFGQNDSFTARDLANIERIEILKGHSSLLYGDGAPGGTVNYLTKKPESRRRTELSLSLSEHGFRRGEVDTTGPLTGDGAWRHRLVAMVQEAGTFLEYSRDDRHLVAPSLAWRTPGGGELLLELEYYWFNSRNVDLGAVYDQGRIVVGSLEDPRTDEDISNRIARLYFTQPLTSGWELRLTGQVLRHRYDSIQAGYFRGPPGELLAYAYASERTITSGMLRAEVSGDLRHGSVRHRLLAGAEALGAGPDDSWFFYTDGFYSAPVGRPEFGFPLPELGRIDYSSKRRMSGLYLLDHVALGDRWKLLGGLRYSRYRDESDGVTQVEADNLSPTAGVLFDLFPSLSLYTSHSRSFAPNGGTTAAGEFFDPQQGEQVEFGLKGDAFQERLAYTVSVYEIVQDNLTTSDPENPSFNALLGEVSVRGAELEVSGRLPAGLSALASFTLTEAEITRNNDGLEGNTPPGVPRRSAALRLNWEANARFRLGAGLIAVGRRPGNEENEFTLPGYARVDLDAAYRWDRWQVAVAVENVGDIGYLAGARYADQITPGRPRTLSLKTSYRW